jgi:CheY-like chemotaxis protein
MSATENVNILMVDDHADKLLTYEAIFSELGENLIKAGREALEQLPKNDIALVLLDVIMPIQDGFELATRFASTPALRKRRLSSSPLCTSATWTDSLDSSRERWTILPSRLCRDSDAPGSECSRNYIERRENWNG